MSEPPALDGVAHRTVRARGLDFHVAEAGSGDDVVLCLHGWPQHWYEWRHLMPALADRHRVLALDLRGFGWSDAPRDGYEKEDMATDVLAVLDELGLERVKLVGHDWGGWIGFLLCLRSPRRFERFLALNILPPRAGRGGGGRFSGASTRGGPVPPARAGSARRRRTVPTRLVFGTDDKALRPEILAGYQHHGEDMELELVPGCGHFIADERPD